MLSMYTLKSAAQAASYYQQGDYSTTQGAATRSEWFGKGAAHFKLEGPVDFAVFEKLLEGILPDGQSMTQALKGQHHRPGYDLTFSAPKSVSILALVAGNQAILQAHQEAVRLTLEAMEAKYAATRLKDKGVVSIHKTGTWIRALFEHVDSRAGDPGLHTHAVLSNMTQLQEGVWRTLFADPLYRDKMLNGLQYRSFLAPLLLNLGYALDFKPGGLFEIKGLEALIEAFSKRRSAILDYLERNDQSGGKAAHYANFQTREAKKDSQPDKRLEAWMEVAKHYGFPLKALEDFEREAKARGPIPLPDPKIGAGIALDSALAHLSELYPAFSMFTLVKTAGQLSLFAHNEADFLRLIEAKIQDKSLSHRAGQLVSVQRLRLEQSVKEAIERARSLPEALMPDWMRQWTAKQVCDGSFEAQSLEALLKSRDPQLLIKATGEQGLEKLVISYCRIAQYQYDYPRILCQTALEVEALKSQYPNQRVYSIEGFLRACLAQRSVQDPLRAFFASFKQRSTLFARDIWIVLGALNLSQVQRLQAEAEHQQARLIFASANPSQTTAFLEQAKIPVIEAACRDKVSTPEAVLKALQDAEARGVLTEISDPAERLEAAIQHCSQSTLIPLVVLSGFEVQQANEGIRATLEKQGRISGPAIACTILKAVALSQVQKSQAHAYQIGDRLCIDPEIGTRNPATYWQVEASCVETGLLELSSAQQALWTVDPRTHPKKWNVFRTESRTLQAGDTIRWTRSLKASPSWLEDPFKKGDRIKGQRATVLSVHPAEQQATLRLGNGLEICLQLSSVEEQHWDYAYAIPLYQAGPSFEKSVLLLDAQKLNASSLSKLQQALKSDTPLCAAIFCSNRPELYQRVMQPMKGHAFFETPYDRATALAQAPLLSTHLLFPGLEKAYYEAKGTKPALSSRPQEEASLDAALRLSGPILDRVCMGAFEREAVLSRELLKAKAAGLANQQLSFAALDRAFDRALQEGWLHRVGQNAEGEALLSPRHILLMEKQCRRLIVELQNQVKPLLAKNSGAIEALQNDLFLSEGQRAAIECMLTTPHRIVAVQGIAGSGKTTALNRFRMEAEKRGFKPLVLANLSAATEKAKDSSGMEAMTTAQFLSHSQRALRQHPLKAKQDYRHRCIIVDEASLLSTESFLELAHVVTALDLRLTIMGDFKQQGSIRWGILFHDLMAYGLKTVVMRENIRLKNIDAFKALQKTYAGDIQGALSVLGPRVIEIPDKAEALAFMIQHCQDSMISDKKIWPIVPTHADRKIVNEGIRKYLLEQRALESPSLEAQILVRLDRLEADKPYLSTYAKDDIVLFKRSPNRAIQAFNYALVVCVEAHRLILRCEDGSCCYWSPKDLAKTEDIELYRAEPRVFCVGERILFTRTQRSQGLINGEFGTLRSIEGSVLNIELKNRLVALDLSQRKAQHLDYGYALTTYKVQGQEEASIAYGESPRPHTRQSKHLRIEDEVVLTKKEGELGLSSWVKVQEIRSGSQIHLLSEHPQTGWNADNTPALLKQPGAECELVFFDQQKKFCRVLPSQIHPNLRLPDFVEKNSEKTLFLKDEAASPHPIAAWFRTQGCALKTHCQVTLFDQQGVRSIRVTDPNFSWSYRPPFEQRQAYEIPKSSTQQALLVQSSRGDHFRLITAHKGDFQKSVEAQALNKRSAASFADPHWAALHRNVERLVSNIESQPAKQAAVQKELEAIAVIEKRHQAWMQDPSRSASELQAWTNCNEKIAQLLASKDHRLAPATSQAPVVPKTASERSLAIIAAIREALTETQAYREATPDLRTQPRIEAKVSHFREAAQAKALASKDSPQKSLTSLSQPPIERER